MSVQKKIVTARTQLLLDNPFFGNIAMRLNLIESDQFDTMATDGSSIWFNPAFVDKHTNAHLKGVLAHEVCHVIFKHHLRRGQRDPNNWNTAADYAINSILVDAGFSLPEDGLIDLAYRGQSAEDIYRKLFDDQPEPEGTGESEGDAQGDAEGGDDQPQENSGSGDAPAQSGKDQPVDMQGHGVVIDGTSDDGSGLTASEIKEEEDKWTEIVLNAAMISGEAGKEDSPFKQHITLLRKPVVDWRGVLRRFLLDGRPSGTSYQRLGRRSRAVGVPLPTRRRDVGGEIAVLVDVSSSVDDEMFAQFCEELQSITSEFDITSHVIKFTHTVKEHQVVDPGDEIDRTRYYGGTNTRKALEYVDEQQLDIDAIIIFSDMEDIYSDIPEPALPTLLAACVRDQRWLDAIEEDATWATVVQVAA